MKTVLTWLAIIIGAMWLINNPASAAAMVHHIVTALTTLASSL